MDKESKHKSWFVDHLNPTYKELELWMEDPASFEPEQDWDIIIGVENRLPTFVKLANNDGPQRVDIIHYLHVSTENAFNFDRKQILRGIRLVPNDAFSDLLHWKRKALLLLESPSSFRESEWFDYRHNQ